MIYVYIHIYVRGFRELGLMTSPKYTFDALTSSRHLALRADAMG